MPGAHVGTILSMLRWSCHLTNIKVCLLLGELQYLGVIGHDVNGSHRNTHRDRQFECMRGWT